MSGERTNVPSDAEILLDADQHEHVYGKWEFAYTLSRSTGFVYEKRYCTCGAFQARQRDA